MWFKYLVESKRRPENKDLEEMKKELAEQEARKKEREEEMAKEIPNNVRKESPLKEDDEQDEAVFYF